MFVFDVSDTEPGPDATLLPSYVEKPFEVRSGKVGSELEWAIENAKRDGIEIITPKEGSLSAGSIMKLSEKNSKSFWHRSEKDQQGASIYVGIPIRYTLLLNENLSSEARYATLTYELGHLYCDHLGTPNRKWWPDRPLSEKTVAEFKAKKFSFLVCSRKNINNPSDLYLSGYLDHHDEINKSRRHHESGWVDLTDRNNED